MGDPRENDLYPLDDAAAEREQAGTTAADVERTANGAEGAEDGQTAADAFENAETSRETDNVGGNE